MSLALTVERREDFETFLEREKRKDILRFTTAGSVDDGKSTLIGRLLHDSKAVYEDQIAAVRRSRVNRSGKEIDLSLLTDGLRAEREQGITIDVAYRYFSTPGRKFIIADTPGHEQYTRNMATGASTADLAVVLLDATRGVLAQTRRHAYIASLLGIANVVAAINKMDLVDYSETVFAEVEREFRALARSLQFLSVECIPVSALEGDNIVDRGQNMPWYQGPTLIEHLEKVDIQPRLSAGEFRFPVQSVVRPDATFRGFAGSVASGVIRRGDSVVALPSQRRSKVKAILTYDGEMETAVTQQAVVLQLEDEIDLSRGDVLASPSAPPVVSAGFSARVVWLHEQPLQLAQTYLLKHTSRLVKVKSRRIRNRVDINDFTEHPATQLHVNEIGFVEFEASSALFFDPYERNRVTGSFILIDPLSNATVGAGMIQQDADLAAFKPLSESFATVESGKAVSSRERATRHGHLSGIFCLENSRGLAERVERLLFENNFQVFLLLQAQFDTSVLTEIVSTLWAAGFVIVYADENIPDDNRRILNVVAGDRFFDLSEHREDTPEPIEDRALALAETLRIEQAPYPKGRRT